MRVFADTFYFIALLQPGGRDHELATRASAELAGGIVTTSAVLNEVGNFFSHRGGRRAFCALMEKLKHHSAIQVVFVDGAMFDRGLALFRERPDKEWSLTDCISFVVMSDMGLTDALTADHHFVQAGYRAVLSAQQE